MNLSDETPSRVWWNDPEGWWGKSKSKVIPFKQAIEWVSFENKKHPNSHWIEIMDIANEEDVADA